MVRNWNKKISAGSIESINELKLLLWKPESSVSCPWFRAICGNSTRALLNLIIPSFRIPPSSISILDDWVRVVFVLCSEVFPCKWHEFVFKLMAFLFFFMVLTALNRRLLKPVFGLLKFFGSFGALTLRDRFPGIRNLCHVHGEYFIYVYIFCRPEECYCEYWCWIFFLDRLRS